MLEALVRYLRDAGVPFRLASYPSPEPLPAVAHAIPSGTALIDTHLVRIDGRLAIACTPEGASVETTRLARALGAHVVTSSTEELPDEFRGAAGPIPPTAGLFGVPLFVDDELPKHALLVFRAFAPHDYVELAYEDFARIERPRVTSLASWGELPAHAAQHA